MDLKQLEEALHPYEKKLRAQEKFRHRLGVKEVELPTYERYIIGPIERFDRRKNAFALIMPDNPFGEEIRQRFKERTGHDSSAPLPFSELEEPSDRIGQSLTSAAWRLCREHHPETRPVTPEEGRLEITDKARMSRLIKKVALFLGAEAVRITQVDPRWVYQLRQPRSFGRCPYKLPGTVAVDVENERLPLFDNWAATPDIFLEYLQGIAVNGEHPLSLVLSFLGQRLFHFGPALRAKTV